MRGSVSRKGWVLFAVMCLVWGIPYLFIKVAVEEVAVPVVVFARTAHRRGCSCPAGAARFS